MRSPLVDVVVALDQVRAAAESIKARTGVRLLPVIKADAYGLGASAVADAIAAVADEFVYFSVHEAREVRRAGLALGPPDGDPAEYRELRLRPAVASLTEAARFRGHQVAIKVDTGMQRFGCRAEQIDELAAACEVADYFCHAVTLTAVEKLQAACGHRGRPLHAAATALLHEPAAWLDAVRPGLALYRGAVRVTTRLRAVRETVGPIGYTGFDAGRVGIILAGYSNLLAPGPVLVNGRPQRLLEVGMNTSFVSVAASDREGDEVVLLGDGLDVAALATHHNIRPHEVLCRYCAMGMRRYVGSWG